MSAHQAIAAAVLVLTPHFADEELVENKPLGEAYRDLVGDLAFLEGDASATPPRPPAFDAADHMTLPELQAALELLGNDRAGDDAEASLRRLALSYAANHLMAEGHDGVAPQVRSFGGAWLKASRYCGAYGDPQGAAQFKADLDDLGFDPKDTRL